MPPYLIALRATLVSTFLAQGPLKAEPDASMCVQGVYSGGDPREKKQGTIGMKKKKKKEQTRKANNASSGHCCG